MIERALAAMKLADVEERLAMVRKHRMGEASEYARSPEARDLVAFNLMLAVQSAADLASHIISDEGLAPPRTVAEGFERIARHGVVSHDLVARPQRAVGFRNVVAYGYARMNLDAPNRAPGQRQSLVTAPLIARGCERSRWPRP